MSGRYKTDDDSTRNDGWYQIKKPLSKAINLRPEQFILYPSAYVKAKDGEFSLCKIEGTKKILAMGKGDFFSGLDGACLSDTVKLCPLSHENRLVLNRYLPYTRPSAFGRKTATFGLGDRLGLATPGPHPLLSEQHGQTRPCPAKQKRAESHQQEL